MSHSKPEEQFYDRAEEQKSIPEYIRSNKGCQQVIILWGTSGVGKSYLVEKLLRDNLDDYKSVTVRMGLSSNGTMESLSYFNALYRALAEVAKNRKDYRLKTPGQYGRRNILNLARIGFSLAMNRCNINIDKPIAEPVEDYSVSRKKEFIVSTLKQGPFIVNVQNVQNMDAQSIELFQNITKSVPDLVWIMEYTLQTEESDDNFCAFFNSYNSVVCRKAYHITKLDFDLAFNLASPEVRNPVQRKRIEEQYEKSRGNLITILVAPKEPNEDVNYICSQLNSLSKCEKYITYILYLNEKPMHKSALYSILTKVSEHPIQIVFTQSEVDRLLKKLTEAHILSSRDDVYSIKHDSMIVVLSQQHQYPLIFIAFRALENYYRAILERYSYGMEDCIDHLFSLYVRFHDESLIELFPILRNIISAVKYPKEILNKIEGYKQYILHGNSTDINTLYSVTKFLTELYIKLQCPDEALTNLELIDSAKHNQYLVGLRGAVCSLRNSPDDWDTINSLIERAEENSRLKLSLCLCRLRMMMRSCGSAQSKAYAAELLSCTPYRDLPEYGFLIYNYAEFADTPEDALECYHQAHHIFERYNMVDMQAEVNISMCMSYSYAGRLKDARNAINRAQSLVQNKIPETVLLNNSAVICILEGKVKPDVLNWLADAALLNTNPYEVLIIKSNHLVGLILSEHMDMAADLAAEIEQSDYEVYQYEDFLHIVYQNLFFYYTQTKNGKKVDFYRRKLEALAARKEINESTRTLIQLMLEKKQSSQVFYSRFPFRVDFLGFWGLVISPDLENFQ